MTTHALPHPAIGAPLLRSAQSGLHFTIEHFLLLPVGGLVALIWANTAADSYFTFAHRLAFAVNEIGMALFFALIAQEVYEEVMPGGALHTWRRWTLPVVAAAGGLGGSAIAYLAWVQWHHELLLVPGWPVAAAIDLAFAYFVVKAIFGRHPAVAFLLVLAISANAIGLVAVASRQEFVDVRPGGAALMAAAIGLAWMLRRFRVAQVWPYLAVCGALSWWALYLDGVHPALALIPIVPFLPHAPRSLDVFADPPRPPNAARQLEHLWKYPVHVVLFLFGLVNAGVALQGYDTGTWALLVAALAGKPLGILAAVAMAAGLGVLHMPARFHWRDLAVVAMATSGGFTFGLFFATAVFPAGAALSQLKLGAVASGVGVPLAFLLARWLRVGRFHR
jgi:NhaA family Na+:H+ antiporter